MTYVYQLFVTFTHKKLMSFRKVRDSEVLGLNFVTKPQTLQHVHTQKLILTSKKFQ